MSSCDFCDRLLNVLCNVENNIKKRKKWTNTHLNIKMKRVIN